MTVPTTPHHNGGDQHRTFRQPRFLRLVATSAPPSATASVIAPSTPATAPSGTPALDLSPFGHLPLLHQAVIDHLVNAAAPPQVLRDGALHREVRRLARVFGVAPHQAIVAAAAVNARSRLHGCPNSCARQDQVHPGYFAGQQRTPRNWLIGAG